MGHRFFTGVLAGLALLVAVWAGEAAAQSASVTSLYSAPNPSNFGQSVTLTADVDGLGAAPTGSVSFTDDGVISLGSAVLGKAEGANQQTLGLGLARSCSINAAGGAQCWGDNSNGTLGDGTTTSSTTPVNVVGLSSGVRAISTAALHSCAVTVAGGAKCWGAGFWGILGNGARADSGVPVDVQGLTSDVVSIDTGFNFTCALTTAGGVKCWGNNSQGQLGNNDPARADQSVPVDVAGLTSGVTAISVGTIHACALLSTGGVKCWGYDGYGQSGDLGGLTGVISIAAGNTHTCALTNAGAVKCWGLDQYGQLGDNACFGCGLPIKSRTPVDVVGLSSGVVAISSGRSMAETDFTCALTDTGRVKCWGWGGNFSLGNGSPINAYTPVDVAGMDSGAVSIAAGHSHTCAKMRDGHIKCWGCATSGYGLGNPSVTQCAQTPVDATSVAATFVRAKATRLVSGLSVEDHVLNATYAGDANFTGSDSSIVHSVVTSTTTTLAVSPNPANFDDTITLSASVTAPGGPVPGRVVFYVNGIFAASVGLDAAGDAQTTITPTKGGSNAVYAEYQGLGGYGASVSQTVTLKINQENTSTALESSPNPATFGDAVTLKATVSASAGTATGNVDFFDGATKIGTAALSGGVATLTISTLSGGAHLLRAQYPRSTGFLDSTSAPLGQTVFPAPTTTANVSVQPVSVFGESIAMTATVSSLVGTPTGNVEFFDGATSLGTAALAVGSASLSIAALPVGPRQLSAKFLGGFDYAASQSATPQSHIVGIATATVSVTPSASHANPRQTVSLAIQTTPAAPSIAKPNGIVASIRARRCLARRRWTGQAPRQS